MKIIIINYKNKTFSKNIKQKSPVLYGFCSLVFFASKLFSFLAKAKLHGLGLSSKSRAPNGIK